MHFTLVFSHSVVPNSLRLHGLQHTRLPCPSLSPRVRWNSWPLSRLCHPTISSSVTPSSCPVFPGIMVFAVSQLFVSGDQSIGASTCASVLPMNIQGWFPWRLTGLISLQSGDSQESSPVPQFKSINSLAFSHLPFSKQRFSNMFAVYKSTCLWFSQIAYGLHRADHYSDEDLRLGNMISTSRVSCLVGSS